MEKKKSAAVIAGCFPVSAYLTTIYPPLNLFSPSWMKGKQIPVIKSASD